MRKGMKIIDTLIHGLPANVEDQFTYFDVADAFSVTINKIDAQSQIPPHTHNTDVFNLVLDGEIMVSINDHEASYKTSNWFHIRAHEKHSVRTISPVTLLELWQR